MQTFKGLFEQKCCDKAFKTLYEQECHVCPFTIRIFARIDLSGLDLTRLAKELDVEPQALRELKDADYCDPHLVVALCRHLGLKAPDSCPRL